MCALVGVGRGGPTQGTYEDSDDPGFEDCEGRWEDGEDGHCSVTGIVVVVVSPIWCCNALGRGPGNWIDHLKVSQVETSVVW